jgi:hypothetical protein
MDSKKNAKVMEAFKIKVEILYVDTCSPAHLIISDVHSSLRKKICRDQLFPEWAASSLTRGAAESLLWQACTSS